MYYTMRNRSLAETLVFVNLLLISELSVRGFTFVFGGVSVLFGVCSGTVRGLFGLCSGYWIRVILGIC